MGHRVKIELIGFSARDCRQSIEPGFSGHKSGLNPKNASPEAVLTQKLTKTKGIFKSLMERKSLTTSATFDNL